MFRVKLLKENRKSYFAVFPVTKEMAIIKNYIPLPKDCLGLGSIYIVECDWEVRGQQQRLAVSYAVACTMASWGH